MIPPFTETPMLTRVGFLALATLALAALSCSVTDDDSGQSNDTGSDPAAAVVVNEFNAQGSVEWLELANTGIETVDLGDYGLADTDKSTGLPKTGKAMRFPAGTTLAPGAFVLVLTSVDGALAGLYPAASCLSGVAADCYKVDFGISAASGESIHLIAPDDTVVSSTPYPSELEPDTTLGQTVCRMPDKTGDFAVCAATPAAANSAP